MIEDRYLNAFFSTVLLYVGMAAWLIVIQAKWIGTEQQPQEKVISFSLAAYEAEVIPPMEERPVIEEVIPEKVEELEVIEPEPIIEEVKPEEPVVEELKPEPMVEKVIPKPKPMVKKKIIKKKPKKRVKKVVKKRVKKSVHKKAVSKKIRKKVRKNKMLAKMKASPAKKNKFLNQLRSKINRYKTYPRMAQRRGMQGTVNVRFTILANGQVGSISVSGPKVFYTSVKRAVRQAFPLSVKNAPLSLPTTVNLTLRYQLR